MEKLKKGDIIVCIINTRAENCLTVGNEYPLQADLSDVYDYNKTYNIFDDDGDLMDYSIKRFITKAEFRSMKINNIIK